MTLIFITVISLIILTSMQHILLYHKMVSKQEEAQEKFYQLEKMALKLNRHVLRPSCSISYSSANQIIQKLIHQQGCYLKKAGSDYFYLKEDLGVFHCLTVMQNNKKYSTRHQRLSIATQNNTHTSSALQIRLVHLGPPSECKGTERMVKLGISSWRYLPGFHDDYGID